MSDDGVHRRKMAESSRTAKIKLLAVQRLTELVLNQPQLVVVCVVEVA